MTSRPHSIISREPPSERPRARCSVPGCVSGINRHVFVCGNHWLLIESNTRTDLVTEWERYADAAAGSNEARSALVRFYSIARHKALPQIRANLAAGPLVLAEAHP